MSFIREDATRNKCMLTGAEEKAQSLFPVATSGDSPWKSYSRSTLSVSLSHTHIYMHTNRYT